MHRCGHEIEDEYAKDIYTKVERKRLEMKEAMNIETVWVIGRSSLSTNISFFNY